MKELNRSSWHKSSNPDSLPPILIGGVSHPCKSLKSAGCDYLTVSMSGENADALRAVHPANNDDKAPTFTGYKFSELRSTLGGFTDRHWGAYTPSKKKGDLCELWAWRGATALCAENLINETNVQPSELFECTRFDMAFDYVCDMDFRPVDLRDSWETVWGKDGLDLKPEVAGCDRTCEHTAYLGGRTSDRRIKIYRKDLERKSGSPTVRIELTLKGVFAQEIFIEFLKQKREAVVKCATHILTMTGFEAVDEIEDVVLREPKAPVAIAHSISAMIDQYGKTLAVAVKLGVDLESLVEVRKTQLSRKGIYRWGKSMKEARGIGVEKIDSIAMDLVLNK